MVIPTDVVVPNLSRPSAIRPMGLRIGAWTALLLAIAFGPLFFIPYPGLQDYPQSPGARLCLALAARPHTREAVRCEVDDAA